MSRIYGFHAPQERIEPKFWRSSQDFSHVNAGRFLRNSVLSGMCYGGNDLVPAFLKTCDAIHPLCGTESIDGTAQSCYGGLLDSVNSAATKGAIKSVVQPWNSNVVWAPGGTGVDAWLAVKLLEQTLVERYVVASTASTCPLSWKLQGSLDGSTWADLHVVDNTGVWTAAREVKTFTVPEETRGVYLWYRLYVTASNAAAMSISTFRLLRAQSVCDVGQLRLDVSAASPLVLSFMNGFASDGVTPVDVVESLSSPVVFNLADMNSNVPMASLSSSHCDIVAQRDLSGSVVVSLEVCGGSNQITLSSNVSNGFCVKRSDGQETFADAYLWFMGGYAYHDLTGDDRYKYILMSRNDNEPFYVDRLLPTSNSYCNFGVLEINGSYSLFSKVLTYIRRRVKAVAIIPFYNGERLNDGPLVYSFASPYKYRVSGGKLFQQGMTDVSWNPVCKIKLGSCDILNGSIMNVEIRSAQSMQWQTDGNFLSTLG